MLKKCNCMDRIINTIKKLYSSGALHITIGSFLTKFVAFFGSIFVVRLLSKTDYGILQYVENLYSYALVLGGLGLPYAILRHVVKAEEIAKKSFLNYIVSHCFVRDIILCLIILIVNEFIVYPDEFSYSKFLIPILAILLPFHDLVTNGLYALRAMFKNKEYALWAFIISVLLICGRIVGAKFFAVDGVLYSRLFINICFAVGLTAVVLKIYPKSIKKTLSDYEKKDVNKYSFQYMITSGLWVIFMLNDSFLLALLTNNPDVVADYKVAYVLPGNLSLISTAIGIFVGPYFTRNEKNYIWVKKNFILTFLLTLVSVCIMALPIIIFAEPLISFIYGNAYINIVPLMRILLVAALINSGFRYVAANILSAMGKIKSNLIISSIGMFLQIVIDIALIPHYGAMGVAVSNCVVFSIMSLLLFWVVYKYTKEKKCTVESV